jgi:hypothetical protein
MTPQTLPSVLPESSVLQPHTIDTMNRKCNNLTGITQVISQNNCTQKNGRAGIKCTSNWVRLKDSTAVVTKG